jgi:hypothetical protein
LISWIDVAVKAVAPYAIKPIIPVIGYAAGCPSRRHVDPVMVDMHILDEASAIEPGPSVLLNQDDPIAGRGGDNDVIMYIENFAVRAT